MTVERKLAEYSVLGMFHVIQGNKFPKINGQFAHMSHD